jgi:hypothetical protein
MGKNDYINEFKLFNPWISSEGIVTWVPEIRLHTKCVIKVKDFPFDIQCCEINFYSWAHTASQMHILQFKNKNVTNITHLATNTEWIIYDTCAFNKTIVTSENLEWSVTSYVLYIKRESIYHFYTLLMPCVVLSMLSVLLFWLPPDSNEKITLGVTILLAFFVNSLVVSDYTPEASSELPVIGVYYTFNIFMVALSLTGSVLILKLHIRGHRLNKVPKWLKKCLFIDSKKLAKQRSDSVLLNVNKLAMKIKLKNNNFYKKTFPVLKRLPYNVSNLTHSQNGSELNLNLFGLKINQQLNQEKLSSSGVTLTQVANNIPSYNVLRTNKLMKLLKSYLKKNDIEKKIKKNLLQVTIEWKEVARRLEILFLILSFSTILLAPIFLFGKFFERDFINKKIINQNCGCEYSFVK